MNREDWLMDAVSELRPLFSHYGESLPLAIKVSAGIPSTAKRSGAIGECWADTTSSDGSFNIFISPTLENPVQIFETLVHELCHATAGAMNHGVNFQRVADAMHLIPCGAGSAHYKATKGNLKFMDVYGSIIAALGEYPHGALTMTTRKKQGTRMMLALCPSCGFKVRLTQHWADKGLPTCGTKLPNGSGVCDTKFILA